MAARQTIVLAALLLAALATCPSAGAACKGKCPKGDKSDSCRRCPVDPNKKAGPPGSLPCCTGACGGKLGCCGWNAETTACECLKEGKSQDKGNICVASSTGTDGCQHDCDCAAPDKCVRDASIKDKKVLVNCVCG